MTSDLVDVLTMLYIIRLLLHVKKFENYLNGMGGVRITDQCLFDMILDIEI